MTVLYRLPDDVRIQPGVEELGFVLPEDAGSMLALAEVLEYIASRLRRRAAAT